MFNATHVPERCEILPGVWNSVLFIALLVQPACRAKQLSPQDSPLPVIHRPPKMRAPGGLPSSDPSDNFLRCHVARDFDPLAGQWYRDLEDQEVFQVLSVDPDEELLEIQYEDGEVEEIDLDTWHELDLEKTVQPEGWSGSEDDDLDDDDDEWDEDEDEDEDDDWDDDDDDMDDEYDDRN